MWMAASLAFGQTFGDWLGDQPRREPQYDTIESYRTSAAAFWEIGRAMDAHPGTARVEAIGQSIQQVPIWAFHLGPEPADADHSVLIFANLHALEWIGTDVAVDLLLELMLEEEDVAGAMRLIKESGLTVPPERMLDAAAHDESLYHVVFRYFEARGHSWPPEEIQRFSKLFAVINDKATS